ncbi:Ig-like domain-containing protein [Pseudomonas sp. PDM19]|uniref:Ig-like domain-containing protein n=1 Tax=Pseudomonas sp. PDM19 TaxID=2769272 RepID=UPI001781D098|nr:Ig-like domain-containing protein [Pseudomonas sp. PDM19]MBD9628689.1 Ig-like domain-containing protein [Pseudomonas sp. PDM19]
MTEPNSLTPRQLAVAQTELITAQSELLRSGSPDTNGGEAIVQSSSSVPPQQSAVLQEQGSTSAPVAAMAQDHLASDAQITAKDAGITTPMVQPGVVVAPQGSSLGAAQESPGKSGLAVGSSPSLLSSEISQTTSTSASPKSFVLGATLGAQADQASTLSAVGAPQSYTVVVDASGSMGFIGLNSVKMALMEMVSVSLRSGSAVTFNLIEMKDTAKDLGSFKFSSPADPDYNKLLNVINGFMASGNSNYEASLKMALANLQKEASAGMVENKQVFFISNGSAAPYTTHVPSAATLKAWHAFMDKPSATHEPIPVTTFRIGAGIGDYYLSQITTSATIEEPSAQKIAETMLGTVTARDTQLIVDPVTSDNVVNLADSKAAQTVSGKVVGIFQAGDVVKVDLHGTLYSTTVNAKGEWSVSVPGGELAAGTSIHASIVAHSKAGAAGTITQDHAYSVDLVAPAAPDAWIDPAAAGVNKPTIEGKTEPGAVVTVTFPTGETINVTADKNGDWTVTPVQAMSAGNNDIILIARDAAGNPSSSKTLQVLVDVLAPEVPGLATVIDQDTAHPLISGVGAEKDVIIHVFSGATQLGSVVAGDDGSWSFKVPAAMAFSNGEHSITLRAEGPTGKLSDLSEPYTINISAVEPGATELTIAPVAGDDIVNLPESKTEQTVSGKVRGVFQEGDQVTFTLNGHDYSATVGADGKWSVSVAGGDLVANDLHAITATVIAHGEAGKVNTVTEVHAYEVNLDTPAKPSIEQVYDGQGSIQGSVAKGGATDDAAPVLSGKAEAGSTVTLYDNGSKLGATTADKNGKWSFTPVTNLSEGSHAFTVEATNAMGNTSVKSDPFNVITDYTGPNANSTFLSIDAITGDDFISVGEAKANVAISGKVSGDFTAGDLVSVTVDGTQYNAKVAADGSWSTSVPGSKLVADGSQSIVATLVAHDAAGNAGTITASPHGYTVEEPELVITIDSMSKDSSTDLAHSVDFITADGTAGRGVYGSLSKELLEYETVQVSFDKGATWTNAVVSGQNWVAVDTKAHSANWTIQARVFANISPPLELAFASQDVTYLAPQVASPTITGIPDSIGGYTLAKAADGSDVNVSLANTGARAGDTVHIIWGNTTYDQVLTAADIAKGSVTANVPAVQTLSQGVSYSFGVTAQIVTDEGQISNPSSVFALNQTRTEIHYETRYRTETQTQTKSVTYLDNFDSEVGYSGSFYSRTGHFTVNSFGIVKVILPGGKGHGGGLYIGGITDPNASGKSAAIFTFDNPVTSFSYDYWGTENIGSNGSLVQVFDSSYRLIYSYNNHGPYGLVNNFSYSAPSGTTIGKVMVYSDMFGLPIDNFTTTQQVTTTVQVQVPYLVPVEVTVTAPWQAPNQKLIDHPWESYFSDSISSSASDVISMSIDPTAYFKQSSAHVHGGNHMDTLKLTGKDQVLDLRGLTGESGEGKISSIEKFDITGTGNNTLKISLNEVLHLGETDMFRKDGKVQVMVDGNAGDIVELYGLEGHGAGIGGWQNSGTATIGGVVYQVYSYNALDAEIFIKQGVTTSITISAEGGGAGSIDAMAKDTGVLNDFITEDGSAGRLVTGKLSGALASGSYLEASSDNGASWSKVTAISGSEWAFVDKIAHTSDWSVQLRVSDGTGLSANLANQKVALADIAKAPTILSIPKADDGLLTASEAYSGVDMVVSLADTGAKAGDIVHVQWGVGLYDQALTAANITAGQVTVKVPSAVAYSEQGVAYNFNVSASIVSNGVAGASSQPYAIVGGGFATKAISDTTFTAGAVSSNVYTGTDFSVSTSGTSMAKTVAVANKQMAGLTLGDASNANATVTLSQPATKFAMYLSGAALAKTGATVYVYGVDGKELAHETLTTPYYYKYYTYTATAGVEVGSFKVVAGSDSVTLSSFSFTEALHVSDTRAQTIDHATDSYYGTAGDDVALLKYAASSYLAYTGNTGIHGGDGVDTLKVENYNQVLDLTLATSKGKVSSMEIIDLTSTNASYGNTLKLSVQDVLENGQTDLFHSTDKHTVQMMVKGNAKSVVNLDDLLGAKGPDYGDWANNGSINVGGTTYNVYQHSGLDAELLVQQAVKVNLV